MQPSSSKEGYKKTPLQLKVLLLILLYSTLFIYLVNQNVIEPLFMQDFNGEDTATPADVMMAEFTAGSDIRISTSSKMIEPIRIEQSNDMKEERYLKLDDEILAMRSYRKSRNENFDSWFGKNKELRTDADSNGTILDFAIAGKSLLICTIVCFLFMNI